MALARWDPFREMISLREAMDRLFEESFVRPPLAPLRTAGTLAVDVRETDDAFIINASVPGLKPEDLNINVVGDTVTISGEIKEETKEEEANYIYRERRFGSFTRTVTLPTSLNPDKAEAVIENGVLTLTIPKAEAAKPKAIKVKTK
ncbi:MAG: Hsp20/alpha crystallin family protein [Anaerolineae bacterium]|nr:Hsp20/alpha crystallin family protein [Anaerolineae bacterium]